MSEPPPDIVAYADSVAAMSRALAAADEHAFRSALSAFDAVRDGEVLTGVRKVTVELQSALRRFEIDARLIGMAHKVPDARRRLEHVLRLTNDAAHRTMDLVEQCGPLVQRIEQGMETLRAGAASGAAPGSETGAAAGALREQARASVIECLHGIRSRLGDVRLAQSYQDLTGQIVRSVMALVDELQRALSELAAIVDGKEAAARREQTTVRGRGPVVPGVEHGQVVSGQQDVDALLSDLGM